MQGRHRRVLIATLFSLLCFRADAEDATPPPPVEVIISADEQRLVVMRDGMWTHKFRVSTSKFGIGDSFGSYKTPLGKMRVCDKIGSGLASGAVMKHRSATGEILPVNAPGRDPIVTRILWLEGLEPCNQNAKSRGIYIHGTVEESKIGDAVSYGCIRMKSRDVMELFDLLPVGTPVVIQKDKIPKLRRWTPPPETMIAAAKTPDHSPVPEEAAPVKKAGHERLQPIAEKTAPSTSRLMAGRGHGVVSHREAATLHRHGGTPGTLSNPSSALKESILFADLPKPGR